MAQALKHFFKNDSSTGILLIIATLFAMIIANSSFSWLYDSLVSMQVVVKVGDIVNIDKPFLLWVNDGLMAVFFFMVGMEVKHEIYEGSLKSPDKIALPVFAAIGGMAFPALIYTLFNYHDASAMHGWAIPAATDIGFAIGILSLLGNRVPGGLKIYLLALAIIDDLGAIVIIALFYTSDLSVTSLIVASAMIAILVMMNLAGHKNYTTYILIGIVLWIAVLKSGVHATLAGVILGLLLPIKENKKRFHELEHSLKAPVNFIILPIFAFANAGIGFHDVSVKDFTDNVTLGIMLGLFLGKQLGVFLFSAIAIKLRLGSLPEGVNWKQMYGVAVLSGIGFTMSLFIGSLAFERDDAAFQIADERIGILLGSLFSGILGYMMLRLSLRKEL